MFEIAESSNKGQQNFLSMNQLVTEVVEQLIRSKSRDKSNDVTGMPTGFIDLDGATSGLQPGDLIIVAGRPSMGKTAFSINIAETLR